MTLDQQLELNGEMMREEDIAKGLHVAYSTFYLNIRKIYPDLVAILKEENEYIIAKSVRTLMQMA